MEMETEIVNGNRKWKWKWILETEMETWHKMPEGLPMFHQLTRRDNIYVNVVFDPIALMTK